MARRPITTALVELRRLVEAPSADVPDTQLLARFIASRDETAFAALVRRHGPMVHAVAKRLLGDCQHAEDVCQAAFLVLSRKANSIRRRASVGAWLHGVAWRLARKVREQKKWRAGLREHPEELADPRAPDPSVAALWHELLAILDEEVTRLPDRLRTPLILCCLEGRTHAEVAAQLRWPLGTVKTRLARAKEVLRQRLAGRGLTIPAAALATVLAVNEASAALPAALFHGITKAVAVGAVSAQVAALAEEAIAVITVSYLKVACAAVLIVGLVASGVGLWSHQPAREKPPEKPTQHAVAAAQAPATPRIDLYGDPVPEGAIARLGTVRLRHAHRAWGLAMSPDGKMVASGCDPMESTLHLWDAITGREIRQFKPYGTGASAGIYAVAFSPDGQKLAANCQNQTDAVIIWEVATGKRLASCPRRQQGIMSIAFAPDGKTVAAGGYDKLICICDAETGKEVCQLQGHTDGVFGLAYSPDGAKLASAGRDGTVRLWDVGSGKEALVLRSHEKMVWAVAFASDGKTLASGGADKTVRLWDVASGKELAKCEGHEGSPRGVFFTPDGGHVISASDDRTIRWWDVSTGKETRRFDKGDVAYDALAMSPDGKRLAACSTSQSGIVIWDLTTGKESPPLGGHKGWVMSLGYSPDGATLVSGGSDGAMRLWDVGTRKELGQFARERGWFISLAVAPDGRSVAAADYDIGFKLREIPSGKTMQQFAGHEGGSLCVAFHPSGQTIASGGRDKTVRLWDVKTGNELRVFSGHTGEVQTVAFSPDGKRTVSGGGFKDAMIFLWDVQTGKELGHWKGSDHSVSWAGFTPDSQSIVSASVDRTIRFWDPTSGKELRKLEERSAGGLGGFTSVDFSRSGRYLLAGSQSSAISIWEVATGQKVREIRGHQGSAYRATYAPDGKTLASASGDSTILLWPAIPEPVGRGNSARPLSKETLDALWQDLSGADAAKAFQAIGALVAAPEQGVRFLNDRLLPVRQPDAQRITQWISQLDSEQFSVRQKANEELERQGESAESALRKMLESQPTLEARRRIEELLDKLATRRLLVGRALEVLEHIGTADAKQLLAKLAAGAPGAMVTEEAKAALERLARR